MSMNASIHWPAKVSHYSHISTQAHSVRIEDKDGSDVVLFFYGKSDEDIAALVAAFRNLMKEPAPSA